MIQTEMSFRVILAVRDPDHPLRHSKAGGSWWGSGCREGCEYPEVTSLQRPQALQEADASPLSWHKPTVRFCWRVRVRVQRRDPWRGCLAVWELEMGGSIVQLKNPCCLFLINRFHFWSSFRVSEELRGKHSYHVPLQGWVSPIINTFHYCGIFDEPVLIQYY